MGVLQVDREGMEAAPRVAGPMLQHHQQLLLSMVLEQTERTGAGQPFRLLKQTSTDLYLLTFFHLTAGTTHPQSCEHVLARQPMR